MANIMEIMQLCRLCLVKDQVNIPIFEEQGDIRQIFLKISACLPVKVSREDNLPKKICDGCSYKLEMLYQFWNTSANSEKQLLKWLSQVGIDEVPTSDKTATTQPHSHSISTDGVILKQEVLDLGETHADEEIPTDDLNVPTDPDYLLQQQSYQSFDEFQQDGFNEGEAATSSTAGPSSTVTSETVAQAPKRKRRAAAMKPLPPQIDSEDEDDDGLVETKIAKTEEQSDDSTGEDPEPTTFVGLPSDNEQPGPSGVGKATASSEAPYLSYHQLPLVTVKELKSLQQKKGRPKKKVTAKNNNKNDKQTVTKYKMETKCKEEDVDEFVETEMDVELKYVCHICKNDEKMSEKQLRVHFKNDHEGKRWRYTLHKEDALRCDVCPKQYRMVKSLRQHMKTHTDDFICETCNTNFKKVLDYIVHLRLHNSEEEFSCVLCEFKTNSINDITNHVNSIHGQDYKYKCKECGKGFHMLSWFREHKNYHTGDKPFECEFCLKRFVYSRYLTAHKNNIHNEDIKGTLNLHECVICKKRYQHKSSLDLHMNVHTGNVAICDICGKTLSSKEKLRLHQRIHTGYKPFSCSFCGKCFTKKPTLVEHERIHTGEKPYTCEYCSKAFSQRSSLVIHMRGHTGEKPYVCHICNKGFAARAMLNLHFKSCKGILCDNVVSKS